MCGEVGLLISGLPFHPLPFPSNFSLESLGVPCGEGWLEQQWHKIFWLFIGSEQPTHGTESSSQQDKACGTISPIPLMGSNKLGMAIGWSSTFETQTSVQGGTDETAREGTLLHSEEITCSITPTKLKNVPSFRTMLKDYTVQGPNRFEAPVYEESATPNMQPQQVFTLNKTTTVPVS